MVGSNRKIHRDFYISSEKYIPVFSVSYKQWMLETAFFIQVPQSTIMKIRRRKISNFEFPSKIKKKHLHVIKLDFCFKS